MMALTVCEIIVNPHKATVYGEGGKNKLAPRIAARGWGAGAGRDGGASKGHGGRTRLDSSAQGHHQQRYTARHFSPTVGRLW